MVEQKKPEIRESLSPNGKHTFGADGKQMTVNLSVADLSKLVLDAIRLAKEPDDQAKQKLVDDEHRRKDQMAQMLQEATLGEKNKINEQARCGHRKQDGTSTVYGQIHSDFLIHPICVRCQKMFPAYEPPRELVSGMGF